MSIYYWLNIYYWLKSLYRSILANLRYKSAASAHKVAAASIKVMSLLLGRSLPSTSTEMKNDIENNPKSVVASLMQAVNQAKTTSEALHTTNSSSRTLPQSNEKTTPFINEVNNRLPGPLSILFSMIPVNKSRLVRKSGLGLCKVILVDAWHVWHEDNVDSIGRKSFEYCLTLLADDDGKLNCDDSMI